MSDTWDPDAIELDEDDPTLLGHDPVLGPSDPEADEHGDNLSRVLEDDDDELA